MEGQALRTTRQTESKWIAQRLPIDNPKICKELDHDTGSLLYYSKRFARPFILDGMTIYIFVQFPDESCMLENHDRTARGDHIFKILFAWISFGVVGRNISYFFHCVDRFVQGWLNHTNERFVQERPSKKESGVGTRSRNISSFSFALSW